MFIDNKYTKWYNNIVNNAAARETIGYVEKHHIIPTSLGGNNSRSNKVALLPREHYICHLLLTKMTIGQDKYKMAFALSMMNKVRNIGEGRYIPANRLYEYARKKFREALDEYWTEEKRAIHSAKISKVTKGRKLSDSAIESARNKVWTEKAIKNRLANCLKSAADRKGKKNAEQGPRFFSAYVNKNKEIILKIWEFYDCNFNRRQISIRLGISWDRVNLAINRRQHILKVMNGSQEN